MSIFEQLNDFHLNVKKAMKIPNSAFAVLFHDIWAIFVISRNTDKNIYNEKKPKYLNRDVPSFCTVREYFV